MDCNPPVSSVHGVFQARILEWVAISFSRGSSWTRDCTCVSCISGGIFTPKPPGKPPKSSDYRKKKKQAQRAHDLCSWLMEAGFSQGGPPFSTVPQYWPPGLGCYLRPQPHDDSHFLQWAWGYCFFSLFLHLTRDLFHDSEVLCCSSESGLPPGGVLGRRQLDPAPFSLNPRSQQLGENSTLRPQL